MKKYYSKKVLIGNIVIGGGSKIKIQSMTTTNTLDIEATSQQIMALSDNGCDIVRAAVQGSQEAFACEKPVVVMECGGRRFVIPNESYGLVAKKFDTDDIADKIIKLIENKRLAQKIAKNGRAYVLKNFSLEGVAEKFYRSFTKE